MSRDSSEVRCARDSDWCDGVICSERGIDCPNAEQPGDLMAALEASLVDPYPVRERSAHGEPKPTTSIERTCRGCGASFLGLAPGSTGLRGIWRSDPMAWFCSTECADPDGQKQGDSDE